MWKKVVGIVLGVVVLVVGGGFAYLTLRQPASKPAANVKVSATPDRIERGRYLYTVADCDGCHSPADESRQYRPTVEATRGAGQLLQIEDLPGKIYARNITPDPETGLGQWSDGEKIRAIREGVSRDGHALFPMMPYSNYRLMSDEDVESLVAYLNTLKPVRNPLPKTEIAFPVNLFIKGVPRPVNGVVPPVSKANTTAYGQYMLTVGGCGDCHTPREKGQPDMSKHLAGGMKFAVTPLNVQVVSANITPDNDTGIGRWTLDYFLDRFRRHRNVPVEALPKMTPENFTIMPWRNAATMTDEDLTAIYNYLRTVTPVTNKVVTHPVELASAAK